jgi:hypothetical protein
MAEPGFREMGAAKTAPSFPWTSSRLCADITERKWVQEALFDLRSHAHYRSIGDGVA